MKNTTLLAILLLSLARATAAMADPTCTPIEISANEKINNVSPSCIVNVYGISNSSQSRSYTTNASGQFMVFDSFGNSGRNSADTGTRTFYLFPIQQAKPSLSQNANGQIIMRSVSGTSMTLNADGSIASTVGLKLKEDPTISGTNKGGVEISGFSGVLLDAGWSMGGQAIEKSANISTFKDAKGNKCPVQNAKIFVKKGWDYEFKYPDNHSLSVFLHANCPNLDLSSFSRGNNVGGSGDDSSSSSNTAQ